ncbi:ketol-acid reductoisomerase [Natronosalvus rutilus]|uniref:Ketol-acid reductoisomerase (NADP(+)) n=1 Tax=Natronosalvus rutilus TaxID=2953753 RepID=A0A9E7NCS6_9EURY|nr:ketol-acid reductoisomerase [Natronosalvus rutilus]UTF55126.1 ketol-acid reductoisomerase [Natronosalvus rutilus]
MTEHTDTTTDDETFTTNIYYGDDADASHIEDKTVAVLGYGSQGHAHALNLHDSGIDVVVGLREDSSSWSQAEKDGLRVTTPDDATAEADVIMFLVPDTIQPAVFEAVLDGLEEGNTVMFAHGFNIHYNQIQPPEYVDVTMAAPKGPGHIVRRDYENGGGTPALIAVEQNYTGEAKDEALAYAQAIGGTRAGVIETTFQEEVETDLFGEQAVLCGGVTSLVKHGYETLVDAGYSPEMAYFECLNELKLIVDLMYEGGLGGMWHSVSYTAEYGGLSRGDRIVDEGVRENMEDTLEEIQNGEFAREWINENQAGRPAYSQLKQRDEQHEIEAVGAPLRDLFEWEDDVNETEQTEVPADD